MDGGEGQLQVGVLDVHKHNIAQFAPAMQLAIQTASFIAIGEFAVAYGDLVCRFPLFILHSTGRI
eukprot:m.58626 g.58626  ORF g.58626 m.58626 type:complete len:65 (-) comp12886_c0_seq1:102-296(-)